MNRKVFFDAVRERPFPGKLSGSQVSGMDAILDAAPAGFPVQHLAYCLATTYHETAHTMLPIEEYGRGAGKAYGKPYPVTGKVYYGRGDVQLTWYDNYLRATKELGVDFVNNPALALNFDHAAKIMFRGMSEGWFTTKRLRDYFGPTAKPLAPGQKPEVEARRIINGTDRAEQIGGYYRDFMLALNLAGYGVEPQVAVKVPQLPPSRIVELPAAQAATPKLGFWDKLLAGLKSVS